MNKFEDCRIWLRDRLEGGAVLASTLTSEAKGNGFSKADLRAAKYAEGLVSVSVTSWRLP